MEVFVFPLPLRPSFTAFLSFFQVCIRLRARVCVRYRDAAAVSSVSSLSILDFDVAAAMAMAGHRVEWSQRREERDGGEITALNMC